MSKETVRKAIVDWEWNNVLASVVQSTTDPTKYWLVICNPDWSPIDWGGWASDTFETVSKNLKAYPYTINYTWSDVSSIVYTVPAWTITKTLNYTGDKLTSVVLSWDTPWWIDLTKTLGYTVDDLTSITYS